MKRRAAALACLLARLAAPAAAADCPGMSPETARALFERMANVGAPPAYRFEGLSTDGAAATVQWSRRGEPCPPIRIAATNCGSMFGLARLRVAPRPDLMTHCPELSAVVAELDEAVAAEHPVGHWEPLAPAARLPMAAVVVVVLGAAAIILRLLRPNLPRVAALGVCVCVLVPAAALLVNVPLAVSGTLAVAWIAFGILLIDRDALSRVPRDERAALLGLFGCALALRWYFASHGPGDLHLNLAAVWSSDVELRWGPAPIALFRLLAIVLGGLQDSQIIWCNIILGSIAPLLVYGILVELGVSTRAALMAACVVAAHPYLIAFSGVLERQPVYLLAALGSTGALLAFLRRGGQARFAAFIIGAMLATTSRPEGAQVLVVYLAALLVIPAPRRLRAAVAVALAVMIPLAYAYAHVVIFNPGTKPFVGGPALLLQSILFSPDFTPAAWSAAVAVGVVLGARHRAAWVAVAILFGLDVTWRWTGLYRMFADTERQVASARYEALLIVPFAIGLALLADRALRARRWVAIAGGVLFAVLTAATVHRTAAVLLDPFTVDHEYRFVRDVVLSLPAGSRLYVFDPPLDDIGFIDAPLVSRFVDAPVEGMLWSRRRCDDLRRDPASAYLYVGSACAALIEARDHPLPAETYGRWLHDCTAIRAAAGEVVRQLEVPARKMSWHDFRDRTVRLAVYRLHDASICLGPAAPRT